jgi:hypothetical protein
MRRFEVQWSEKIGRFAKSVPITCIKYWPFIAPAEVDNVNEAFSGDESELRQLNHIDGIQFANDVIFVAGGAAS